MSEIIVAYPYERRGRELFRVDHCFKDHEGIPRRLKKRGFESRGAAITWGEKELSMIQNGIKKVVPGHKRGPKVEHTVESGLRAILQWQEETGHLKPSTRYVHECTLQKHVFKPFGELPWQEFGQMHCDRLLAAARGMASPRHLLALKLCLESAEKAGLPKLPVTVEVPKSKTNVKTDYLTRGELETLCVHADPLWAAVFRFLYHTGLRIGEFCALEFSDFDLRPKAETVRVERTVFFTGSGPQVQTTKSGRIRVLPLNEDALKSIREIHALRFPKEKWLISQDRPLDRRLLMVAADGHSYVRPCRVLVRLRQTCKRAGMRVITPHQLRHSHASCMVQAGVPLTVVSALLGHSSLEVTGRYAHLAPENLRAGVNVL